MQLAKPAIARHVVSWRVYLAVFVVLAVLTTLSVVVTGFDFGELNLILALAISAAKSTLVVVYFMHLRYSPRLTRLTVAAGLSFLLILVFLTLIDYVSRPWSLTAG
jgi:cytochrome c oxidase subunit 4